VSAAPGDHGQPLETVGAVLAMLERGELGDPLAPLAYVAGQALDLPERELDAARRRALLLRAAGGDPRRDPTIDDRAVKALAAELATDVRVAGLRARVDELAPLARSLPRVRAAIVALAADPDLAWRLFALGLLAETLDDRAEAAPPAGEDVS
jgi:hypothetical protein